MLCDAIELNLYIEELSTVQDWLPIAITNVAENKYPDRVMDAGRCWEFKVK